MTIVLHLLHHTHIGVANEDCGASKEVSNSFKGIFQQGLRSGGRKSGGKKLVHGFADFF